LLRAFGKAQQHGWNPETMQEYQGHMEALSAMGRAGGMLSIIWGEVQWKVY
jgi:hypothetical protein